MPLVIVKSITGRQIHIELRDEANKSRKPAGVSGAVLFVMRDDEPSANVTDWTFMDISTRTRATLRFGAQFPPAARQSLGAGPMVQHNRCTRAGIGGGLCVSAGRRGRAGERHSQSGVRGNDEV